MPHDARLNKVDPGSRGGFPDKKAASEQLEADLERLADLQDRLAAEKRWAVLVILQGIDAAGKDGAIKHVMRGLNPQGVSVHSFREPTQEELAHDFLWRAERVLPERGRIGVFNRSYYEDVLVTRVQPELLDAQRLPPWAQGSNVWKERYRSIRRFEHHLHDNGTIVRKFLLHVSREEQAKRLLERVRDPHKHWKFSSTDLATHERYDDYMRAYEEMLRHTSTPWAPWTVVPADRKWAAHLEIARELVSTLKGLDPRYPAVACDQLARFEQAGRALEHELGRGD